MNIAILLTCFNRRERTLSCLRTVYAQFPMDNARQEVYLVDDGSSDGTADAVSREFPDVIILHGSGDLFWNGGMNLAWKTAIAQGFEYYLWLNDDVTLYTNAFKSMFDSFMKGRKECGTNPVIVGSFHEVGNNEHAYGGFEIKKTLWGVRKKRVVPTGEIKRCDTFNGNTVLIPDSVVKKVGLLDPHFTHSFGDVDYGYRCMEKDIPVFIAPEYVGECARNSINQSWYSPDVTLAERYRRLTRPTGCPPGEYFYSYRKKSNLFAGVIALSKLYLRLLFPDVWMKLSRSKSGE